ncbi:BMC domain-containing protein [Hathewaya proteolytica DSM 3090]|uniref:BMC domain-containing protein n=1 Tax=Hathewaya proteolytica DSM 3090 TaxID=1121331 RepID=A0A1M6KC83_9CLOT|nr:BMC domain-containing protein [Hathewaya proteolytica]SHJ56467.1 BMC domain-containing protein [Hathewaya proteolytica DSM 3090]
MNSLGLIETVGLVCAIEGLDVALKTADVEVIGCECIGGGIVTVKLTGEVEAVRVAVETAAMAVERIGTLRATHVIAKTAEDMEFILSDNMPKAKEQLQEDKCCDTEENKELKESKELQEDKDLQKVCEKSSVYTREDLQSMKVLQLRTIARMVITNLTKKQIKFARKDELIEAILEVVERKC